MKKKVQVRGPAKSRSGYGTHTRFILRALREYEHLFDIYLINVGWGASGQILEDSIEMRWFDMLIEETYHYVNNGGQFDMSQQVTIPSEWERLAPVNIGCTAGTETTKISPQWMQKCNQVIDKIVTVSSHASYAFENTTYQVHDQQGNLHGIMKVEKPVEHVNYCVDKDVCKHYTELQNPNPFNFDTDFNFLVMAQWSPRKNLENTVKWWLEEFYDNEDAGLIVKTHIANDSRVDREYAQERLQHVLKEFPDKKCSVYLIHGTLSNQDLLSLYSHDKLKALISLGNEGFNLPAFESVSNDLPIITAGWGGEVDFLYKTLDNGEKVGLYCEVDYDIKQIQREAVWDGVLQADSYWSFAKPGSYKMKLRELYKNYEEYEGKARELGEYVREEFEDVKQYEKFVKAIDVNGGMVFSFEKPEVQEFD